MAAVFAEYIGFSAEASALIEQFRQSPIESKSDILVRVLSGLKGQTAHVDSTEFFDLGQGARLRIGEKPMLFLTEEAKRGRQPDASAEIRKNGFYLDGKKILASRGNPLQPAMKLVQERKNHRNDKGELISLSAWRQWHVVRDGKLVSMLELKDPALAHRRGRITHVLTPEDIESYDFGDSA